MAIFNRKSGTSQAGDTSSSETAEPGTPTHRIKLAGLRWRKSGRPSRNKISTPELKPNAVKFNPEMEPKMNRFTLNGAVLTSGMSLRQQAKAKADANEAVLVTVSSHTQERRIRRQYTQVEFYAPVNLGSKSRLFICK